jgi:MoaA/NifB/PqqE/SkfB family radical SAM enzyme
MKSFIKSLITGKVTIGQIINYLICKYSPRGRILRYDPVVLSIQTTNRCNLSCDMCQTHSTKIPPSIYHYQGGKDIDLPTFKRFIDKYKKALSVSCIGTGEPLLNKDFFAMVNYAAFKRKMHVATVSNGMVIGEKIDRILESGLNSIEISLNGQNAEEFHRMTGQPERYYPVIYQNIQNLITKRNEGKSRMIISISFILDQQNYRNIFRMLEVAEKLKADEVSFHNFLPSPEPGFTAVERCLYSDNQEVVDILKNIRETYHKTRVNFPRLLDKTRKVKYCEDYFTVLRVDGEGDVGGCSGQLLNLKGNGKFYDRDVWNNTHFRERRRLFLDPNLPELPPCQTCPCNNRPLVL